MEPHKELSAIEKFRPDLKSGPHAYFSKALEFARANYSEQMEEIASVQFQKVSQEYFFREYIWVVHATGFSAKAVGKFMPKLIQAYGPWNCLPDLPFPQAFERVKIVCNNPQKSKAIYAMAKLMCDEMFRKDGTAVPWEEFRRNRLSSPELLAKLPYVGKVTCFHLGRNIGLLECVKPDLHLIRMAEYWGFKNCEEMCRAVRPEGMPLGIVDLVFWYAASTFGTLEVRKDGQR